MNDDPRLLAALAEAIAPPPAEPSAADIAALRRAVARRFLPPRPWWRRRATMLLAAAALCTGTAAAVAGGGVPAPVRTIARAAGLPVDSTALVETRAAARRVRAVASIERFTWEGSGFDAWVFAILRHVVVDVQRATIGRAPAGEPDEAPSPSPGPLDCLLGAESGAALRAAFERLGAFDREVLELRVVAGLSSDEVAAVVGKRPGAVRMAQARALDRLRALLEAWA